MKRLFKLLVLVVVIAVLFPLANLFVKPCNEGALSNLRPGDAAFEPVAELLEKKCVGCHLPDADLPFYAGWPVASGMMEGDIAEGLRFMDMKKSFSSADRPVSETSLAKIEYVVDTGSMPPHQYMALHWDAGLGDSDKETMNGWLDDVRLANYSTEGVADSFKADVIQPLPLAGEGNAAMVSLGDRLFHDKSLSGDDTISCATCHDLAKGGTDRLQFSEGIDGQVGGINSPTVYNAGFAVRQFWDGRAADLKEQAGGPVTNPIEMGAEWPAVIAKLEKDGDYADAFGALFDNGISQENIQIAIAAFEETLVTGNSKVDRFLRGDDTALSADEKAGHDLFKSEGCATCHVGKILGGQSFETMGLREDYFADRGDVKEPDNGRFNFTKDESDRYKFKVPTLRNVAQTYPYLHDGSTSDLKEAVRIMAKYQCGAELDEADLDKIMAFLDALTGEYKGKLLQ